VARAGRQTRSPARGSMAAMSLTLYYVPGTRASRARWMLEELEVPYAIERVDVKAGANKLPAYLAVHPLGHVPALRDDDVTMFESGAIVAYLADKFPEKGLAPATGAPERAAYLQWLFYAVSELEPVVAQMAGLGKIAEAERDVAKVAETKAKFDKVAAPVEKAIVGREFLLGASFSGADVLVAGVLGWARFVGLLDAHAELAAYVKRCTSRPASQRARKD
jgi:glutathione S-transferase